MIYNNTRAIPVLLYASECLAPTIKNIRKLQRNDRAMIRWICNVWLEDLSSSDSLPKKLGIVDISGGDDWGMEGGGLGVDVVGKFRLSLDNRQPFNASKLLQEIVLNRIFKLIKGALLPNFLLATLAADLFFLFYPRSLCNALFAKFYT